MSQMPENDEVALSLSWWRNCDDFEEGCCF